MIDEAEEERRRRIRESDIRKCAHLFEDAFQAAIEKQRNEGVSAVDQAAWDYPMINSPRTADEIKKLEKDFDGCNGLFVWGLWNRLFEEKRGKGL